MKRLIVVALCLFAAACTQAPAGAPTPTSTPSSAQVDEAQAVRTAFEAYTKAALAKDGTTAVSVVASPAFTFFDGMRKLALTATEQELATQKLSTRLMVYTMRGSTDPAILRTGSPQDVVKNAIDKGLVGEQGIKNIELGKVTVKGDTADVELMSRGKKAPFGFSFVREDGTWKFDMMPMINMVDATFVALAQEQDLTPDELLEQVLNSQYGPGKAAELRKPLGA